MMTSWHSGEVIEDVAFFFVNNTNYDEHDFRDFLVLQIGDDPATETALIAAVRTLVAG